MTNNLRKIKQDLCSFAKRHKDFKYTDSALFVFLLTGLISVKNISFAKSKDSELESQKGKILDFTKEMKKKVSKTREENDKLLKSSNLELIQLMEQGDHVIKSPWSSWQYGINYYYDNWRGSFKGLGDKKKKYPYEGKLNRGNWWVNNVSPNSKSYSRLPINSGNEDADPSSSLSNRRNGLDYGLVGTVPVPDRGQPLIIDPSININAPTLPNLNVNPATVAPHINFSIPPVTTVTFKEKSLSNINPNVFNPPALNEVATGFAQDMQGVSFFSEPNTIINNANADANASGTTVSIVDDGFSVNNSFTYSGQKVNQGRSTTGTGTVAGTWTFDQSNPNPAITSYSDARAGIVVTNAPAI